MGNDPFDIHDLAPFGAQIGLDLSRPLGKAQQRALRRIFYEKSLLVFRRQDLSDAAHTQVMEIFGHVLVEEGGHREISANGNLGSTSLLFHSDLAFTPEPFKLLSLFAIDVTEGTQTLFANGMKALDSLSERAAAKLRESEATSVIPLSQSERIVKYEANGPRITRPAIIAHPVTRRPVLFVSEQQTARIEGLPEDQSDELLLECFERLYTPENIYRHSWRNGDLVIWDNIALQHSRPDQSMTPRRRLRRIAVADKTFFQLCPQFPPDDRRIAAWGTGGKLNLE